MGSRHSYRIPDRAQCVCGSSCCLGVVLYLEFSILNIRFGLSVTVINWLFFFVRFCRAYTLGACVGVFGCFMCDF